MLYGVKLNREEVFMAKKEEPSVFTFYMVKKFEEILKWKYLSVMEGVGGAIH